MMLIFAPMIFALILGLVIGSQIKLNATDMDFTKASFIVIILAAIIIVWPLGNYPFYNDLPISTTFLAALIGIIVGRLLFARSK